MWGATNIGVLVNNFRQYFNPRSRVGSDNPAWGFVVSQADFNPRSRVGSDYNQQSRTADKIQISIHAPVWGATIPSVTPCAAEAISIHAPVWGATSLVL
mgnify:CR=1 FL=1